MKNKSLILVSYYKNTSFIFLRVIWLPVMPNPTVDVRRFLESLLFIHIYTLVSRNRRTTDKVPYKRSWTRDMSQKECNCVWNTRSNQACFCVFWDMLGPAYEAYLRPPNLPDKAFRCFDLWTRSSHGAQEHRKVQSYAKSISSYLLFRSHCWKTRPLINMRTSSGSVSHLGLVSQRLALPEIFMIGHNNNTWFMFKCLTM